MKREPILHENPEKKKVPTFKDLGFIKEEEPTSTSKRLTDILKKISSNRKSKKNKRR